MTWPFGDLQLFRYGVILADPPWQMAMYSEKGMDRCPDGKAKNWLSKTGAPEKHYATMPLEQIMALPVNHLAAPDCALLLWAIDPMLPQAIETGRRWGFEFKTVGFYWAKTRREGSKRGAGLLDPAEKLFPMGTGYWTRANPEQCLLFTRGSPERLASNVRRLLVAPRREHSRKPDRIRGDIERLLHGPYCELFARSRRSGWDSWGNDVDRFGEAREIHGDA